MNRIINYLLTTIVSLFLFSTANGQCGIFDIAASFGNCDGATYEATINFSLDIGTPIDTFSVSINDDFIGNYAVNTLPLTIPSIPIADEYHVLICGSFVNEAGAEIDCCEDINVTPPACNENCGISDLTYTNLQCEGDFYTTTIDFNYQNPGNEHFDLWIDGEQSGYYALDDLPISISSSRNSMQENAVILVCINDTPNCCSDMVIDFADCNTGSDCNIESIVVETYDCQDGQFYVDIEVHAQNPGNDGFRIVGNGNNYGNFSYEPTFVTIGPLEGDNTTHYELIVIDNQFPDCQFEYNLGVVNCSGDCSLGGIEAESHCEGGNKYAYITFENPGMMGEYTVHGNGQNYGTFTYSEDGITNVYVGPLPTIADESYEFIIRDVNNEDCVSSYTLLEDFDCGGDECHISDVFVEPHDCQDGQFFVDIGFNASQTGEIYFVYVQGEVFGPFEYSSPFITIGPFAGDGTTAYDFYIIDGSDPTCFGYFEMGTYLCDNNIDLVWPGDANNNNVADQYDILYLGVGFGSTGAQRINQGDEWSGFEAPDWSSAFESGLNYKYADCDGNGEINADDLLVLNQNYGESHGPIEPIEPLPATDTDPSIYLAFPANIPQGVPFEIPLIIGTASTPITDLYGTAFSIRVNPILLESFHITEVQFPSSWMGTPGENLIHISHIDTESGQIDIGISRTNQINASGYGQVATLIGIVDDIAGISNANNEIELLRPIAFDHAQNSLPIFTPMNYVVTDLQEEVAPSTIDQINSTIIFPNPTNGNSLHIGNKYDIGYDHISMQTINGQPVPIKLIDEGKIIDISNLPAGVYVVTIEIGKQVIKRKVIKL